VHSDSAYLGKFVHGFERSIFLSVTDDVAGLFDANTVDGRGEGLGIRGIDVHGFAGVHDAGHQQDGTCYEVTDSDHESLLVGCAVFP